MDAAFQHLKAWICQTLLSVTLAYYVRSKPFMVQTDPSEYVLGAALIQSDHPIAFTSKLLLMLKSAMQTLGGSDFQCALTSKVPYLHLWQACYCTE